MGIPGYQSLMLPILSGAAFGEVRIADLADGIAREFDLTSEDTARFLPSGKQTIFGNRLQWAKFYLGKAGLIDITRRGFFKISLRGREVLDAKPTRLNNEFLGQFQEFRDFKEKTTSRPVNSADSTKAEPEEQTATPDEVMRVSHKQIEASLAQELLDRIRAAPPAFFERLIVNLLIAMGYGGSAANAGRALGRSGDDGVDGVIDQDALGLDRVYVQAKRYASGNNIGSGAIRDFFGSLDRHKAAKGLFVTTSIFSSAARDTAEFLSKRIVLIDGEALTTLMIRYNVGCRVEDTFQVKKIDEDFFE